MASLRETKKEATRRALADASASLALAQGSDAVTVSAIADAAGVSARTFHNYFSSTADALLYFTAEVLEEFTTQVPSLHPLSLIHISEPTRRTERSRMPSSA